MKTPEFFVVGEEGQEERLSRAEGKVERPAGDDLDDVAVEAALALDEYKLNKSYRRFAGIISLIRDAAWSELRASGAIEDVVDSVCDRLRSAIQLEMSRGDHAFANEDISSITGEHIKRGVISEMQYLVESRQELPPGIVRDTFQAPVGLDKSFAIDYLEVYRNINDDGSVLARLDLVQVKSSEGSIDEEVIEDILKSHRLFLEREGPIFVEKFRQMEVSESEVENLIEALGREFAGALQIKWLEAILAESGDPAAQFLEMLSEYRKSLQSSQAYMQVPRLVKRAYIERMELEKVAPESEFREAGVLLEEVFVQWKKSWLDSIKTQKQRLLEPVKAAMVRSVIYPLKGKPVISVIG